MAYTIDDVKKYFTFANAGTGPTAAQTQQLQGIVNQNATGTYNDAQAFQAVVDLASDSTTAVSVETYAFFLGYAPSQAGLAALNAAYVGSGTQANLNGENRFIAQSVSLALSNATAKANFAAAYGSLSIVDATKAAYGLIVGNAAAAAAGINVDNAVAYLAGASSVAYYTAFVKANVPGLAAADLDLAVKAAIVGEIMYQATNFNFGAGVGSYSAATTTLLKDLADDGVLVANNNAGIDLFGSYGGTGTVGSTLTLTTSVDSPVATGNNDTINATDLTFTNLDTVDGLAGNDTLVIADTTGAFSTAGVVGATVKNVENISFKSVSTGTIDTTGWTGVQTLSTTTIGGVTATASGTTAVSVTEAALGAGAVNVQGGSTVSVNSVTTGAGTITVGGTTAPTGAVTVKASVAGTGNTTQGAISVTGGTTVSVTTAATQATNNTTTTQAAVTVTGTSTTTAVTVAQSAAVTAGASVKGIGAGAVTITDANGAHATKAGTIGTVTIANAGAVSITDNSLATLNLSGKVGTVGVTTGAGATVNALALNLGAGSTGAVTLATNYKTLNVGVTGANTVADVSATAATTLNVSGTAAVTFTANAGLTAVTTANVSGSAGLVANLTTLTALTKVDTTATTGTSSVTIDATKVAFAGGAGSDTVTLSGALASGGSISLGAGNDRLVGTTAVAASATSVVDGGTGTDTVASSLINAGNGSLFKAFEVLGLGANTLDAGLLTGSTITGLELYAGGGNGTFTNVVKAQSLSVTGTAAGGTTTLTFSDVAGSADAYTIGFNAATTGTASSPTTVAAGTLSIAGIETVNVVSSSASGVASNTITLLDTAAKSLVVTGSQALTVAFDAGGFGTAGANGLATIDASAATGAITLNTTNAGVATGGLTIVTGSGADVVTLGQGATVLLGAGNDTITTAAGASTITLGGGNDAVDAHLTTVASLVTPVFTTITDTFAAGDSLVFANLGTEVFNGTAAPVGVATTLANALDIAITAAGDTNAQIYWFQYAGNTYVVEHTGASTNLDTTDVVVKLAGLVDLSTASYTAGTNTLLAV
jgi:S-layer protein